MNLPLPRPFRRRPASWKGLALCGMTILFLQFFLLAGCSKHKKPSQEFLPRSLTEEYPDLKQNHIPQRMETTVPLQDFSFQETSSEGLDESGEAEQNSEMPLVD